MNLTKQNVLSYFSQMWRENPLRPPFINTIGHLSQLHVRLGIVLGTLSCLFIAGLLLSPPQGPFCVVGRLGRGHNDSAQGTIRSGKRGNEAFSFYPSSTARLQFFNYCYFYWNTKREPLRKSLREVEQNPPKLSRCNSTQLWPSFTRDLKIANNLTRLTLVMRSTLSTAT